MCVRAEASTAVGPAEGLSVSERADAFKDGLVGLLRADFGDFETRGISTPAKPLRCGLDADALSRNPGDFGAVGFCRRGFSTWVAQRVPLSTSLSTSFVGFARACMRRITT